MRILAIDPGTRQSAWVLYDTETKAPVEFGIWVNGALAHKIVSIGGERLAVEMIASYGMAVGREVFETCVWIGRFIQSWLDKSDIGDQEYGVVYRVKVKNHLCYSARAKDSNVRQAIIDRYPATGGGATPQIGTKKQPGPLYGVSKDVWAALGVAITYAETMMGAKP